MARIPSDPLADGLFEFASRLRRREASAEDAVAAYLARIDALDGALGAYETVCRDAALAQGRAIDQLLRSGVDLGPLMGVPVAIKDIFAVDGTPTTAGSNVDVDDIVGAEGQFIGMLKRAGCIVLGKVKTVEFALGSSGTNYSRGTPRNPWDATVFRVTSGSSSGSAVAMAAGLCGFTIASDTGGSIRGPAAFCGVVGVKTTKGLWPVDGAFPLSPTFDTIGPLTATARDAAYVIAGLLNSRVPEPLPLRGVRLGRPSALFDGAAPEVTRSIDGALQALADAGAEICDVALPELQECNAVFTTISRPEFIAAMGRERFLANRERMNVDVADRAAPGLTVSADTYIQALERHAYFKRRGAEIMQGMTAWIAPSKLRLPPPFPGAFESLERERELIELCAGPTRVATTFGFCAGSQPVQQYGANLPVGMQVICPAHADLRLVALMRAIEQVVGVPKKPDLTGFIRRP